MVTKLKPYAPRESEMQSSWHVIDASGQAVGRLATQAAWLIMGKHRPGFAPHLPSGDFVVITNAGKVRVTGKKASEKVYVSHTQQPGHRKEMPYSDLIENSPDKIIRHAVKGMLPKNKLGARLLTRLKVYPGAEHPHSAQVEGSKRAATRAASPVQQESQQDTSEKPKPAPARASRRSEVKATAEQPAPVRRPRAPK